jgi:hypothetical protein
LLMRASMPHFPLAHCRSTIFGEFDPTRPNQTLERTADRREDLLSMTSTLKPAARLALVRGRSACSH